MASLIRSDLEFILQQILIAEAHSAGADLNTLVPNVFAPYGLRTVDGSYNNLVDPTLGAADQPFPTFVPPNPPPLYDTTTSVVDPTPRVISNLVADMTSSNPAAVQAFVEGGGGTLDPDGTLRDLDGNVIPPGTLLELPNIAPDAGLSAPFNSWFTFFGQFFDHGLDLVNKSSTEFVMMPLMPDDPLYREPVPGEPPPANFMIVSRVTKDADGNPTNATTPFVDQNQTYTSHPSHQFFMREYVLDASNHPVATGKMLDHADGGLPTWADIKAQALNVLGIRLDDMDVLDLPMVRTDPYGNFIPDPVTGMPQLVTPPATPGGLPGVVSASLGSPIDATIAQRTGHAFLNDIAHSAKPISDFGAPLTPDTDSVTGNPVDSTHYDDELLNRHFITGDGRGNENIALTAVHHVFHSEHNRQIDAIKATVLATGDADFIASWQLPNGSWDGERLFQAARFATEMQYQHLVFEEFARKLSPGINEFLAPDGYDINIDPAIMGEFAHAMYRVGHTMLTDSVDRFDADFTSNDLSLLEAFLNPVAYNNDGALSPEEAAGAIVRGMTRQAGNEIDEFVTDAVRNTLLGLPLDLAAINIARGRDTGVPTLNEARREFYQMTSDSQLKPYTSWLDLTQNLKHPASAINFIAAYGTHATIAAATTVADKRAAAMALVLGGAGSPADRLDFLNSTGAYASLADGTTTTGVDAIDLWIGGLAERQMPFGGMLGSTFAFIFETQLESLQNGDRFYYLSRTAGMHFGAELENNSFASLIMLNTDATHLPGDVFANPAFTLEVNQNLQFTGLGDDGRGDPDGVFRNDPATVGPDQNYLRYNGIEHVVLGGTDRNDTIISSEGDDTLYGDGGKDRLEGGAGNDIIFGGAGDDILTDTGGDDVIHGDAGNDVIHGGPGLANILFGGTGNDFIITGEDIATTFGGEGNDFILGSKLNLPTLGNEGDDWIEIGTQDGAGGDNFDPLGLGAIRGNDVFITGPGFDEAEGEGGDDILVFSDGQDNFAGGGGFDWGSYAADPFGVTADLFINARVAVLPTPSNQGIMDRFAEVEGLAGSQFSDYLRGDSDVVAHVNGSPAALDPTLVDTSIYQGIEALIGTGVTSFNGGNIILGGNGSDLLEGRGDNDIIDGDRWLNVRISVRQNADGTGPEIRSAQSMTELVDEMLSGALNPGQLQIVREILPGNGGFNFDTAMFSGNRAEYTISQAADGTLTVNHTTPLTVNLSDGIDIVRNVERLQFNDLAVVLPGGAGLNAGPVGLLTLSDGTPAVGQVLSVSSLGVTDADSGGSIAGSPITYFWQMESVAGSGVFQDIVTATLGNRESATGPTFTVTDAQNGLALRVRAVYKDGHGVLENVYSAGTAAVAGVVAPPPAPGPDPVATDVTTPGIHLIRGDLNFILDQIILSEKHSGAYGTPSVDLHTLIPNERLAWGLRTVDGSFNNLVPGQELFGAADQNFPLLLGQIFRNDLDGDTFDANGPAPGGLVTNTNYATSGPGANVVDADPRIISNLIVDQTASNPAAVDANGGADPVVSPGLDGIFGTADDREVFFIPNTAPDAGLSAQFNSWFTFFGQFFDHGLDLVDKGGNGTIFVPLAADDPLVAGADGIFGNADDLPESQRFMLLTRATNTAVQAGTDGVFGTADDRHFHNNETTPFVDQNQTYTSNASHQVFLREYVRVDTTPGVPGGEMTVATGKLIDGANGGIGNWAEVKAQAQTMLGLTLTDADVLDAPLLAVDLYGKFIPGPNGYAQIVTNNGLVEGVAGGLDIHNLPPVLGVPTVVGRTGHAFLNDIAHTAAPVFNASGNLAPDADSVAGNVILPGPDGRLPVYDNELLDKHFITGDGRGNENIGLTSVHFIFHAEHNRLVDYIKDMVDNSNDPAFMAQWHLPDGSWNGERLFQAARFATEMQYQHLVFEEFARRIQPNIDPFLPEGQNYESTINPAIVAEFAHVVYRFGHSMLTETVDRFDANFDPVGGDQQIGLIAAFLNPLEFTASGATDAEAAGAIIRGLTRQGGNEIDEFVTEALRNNLLGLPLDLPTINIVRGRDAGVPSLNQARTELFAMTGDITLKPYTSWADLALNLKHEASLVNFIAAYGKHSALTAADVDTLAEKRAVALALVLGGSAVINEGTPAQRTFVANNADRLAFLNGPAATTGVDDIDLWIGGLAEKQTPFGGLLGSTFNFVFETQLENLQNADRFYYLERTASLNFQSELEGNSFARLIMANTDLKHLPGLVFDTPAFTLEVDPTKQYTGLGADGRADPTDPAAAVPLVIRNNPATPGSDTNYLQYTGPDHVVLGGTSGDDIIFSSEGDDTLWGDEGDDRLDGGAGNDQIRGGAGDDIITNLFGDDNLQGGDGNDAIHAGSGLQLVIGGHGNDFIFSGNDATEVIAGPGNDFILSGTGNEFTFGNEGDDWVQEGTADGAAGDNFDVLGRDLVRGNDVFLGSGAPDRMDGEGGDDIMIGMGGPIDRYAGFSGFDWAVFTHPTEGMYADMTIRIANTLGIMPGGQTQTQTRFMTTEGMSGSMFSDVLIGDESDAGAILAAGAYGSVLTEFGLINGLRDFVGAAGNGVDGLAGTTDDQFGAGNIILGGGGSDILQGLGGDDLIDGDKWLDVYISVHANRDGSGPEVRRVDSMREIEAEVFSGAIKPGQLSIARQLVDGPAAYDTVVYRGLFGEYIITPNADGSVTVDHQGGIDGLDRLTNIERLQFADTAVLLDSPLANEMPDGLLTVTGTPRTGQPLTVSAADVVDFDNISAANPTGAITGPISFIWQSELVPGSGIFDDILITTPAGDMIATGTTYRPAAAETGLVLRVKAMYLDANGVLETVFSGPTAAVQNGAPTGEVRVSDTTPTEGQTLSAVNDFVDPDGTFNSIFAYEWLQGDVGGGGTFTPIAGATSVNFTPGQAQVNRQLEVRVTYTDDAGGTHTLTSTATTVTGDVLTGNAAPETLTGTAGQDSISGLGGNDTLNGLDENDTLSGGTGNDAVNGGAGNDTINYTFGDGVDTIDGGAGTDTLNITGTALINSLTAVFNGTVLTQVGGNTVTNVESVNADLLGGTTDSLNYTGTTADVTVDLGLGTASGFTSIAGIEQVTGGSGNDTLIGAHGVANSLIGGLGNDIYVVHDAGDTVVEGAVGGGIDEVQTELLSYTLATTFENLSFIGNTGNFTGTGNAADNVVTGGRADDVLAGLAGNDTLHGAAGNDTLGGGLGNDIIDAGLGDDMVNYTFGDGVDTVDGGAGVDTLNVTGTAAANTLAVAISGGVMTSIAGNAVTSVELASANLLGGIDTLTYAGTSDNVTVDLGAGTATGFSSIAGIEQVVGGSGNDTLISAAGVTNGLIGGAGNDIYVVHDATDGIVENAGGGTDEVRTAMASYTLGGNLENLRFTGLAGNFTGTGNTLNNEVTGGAGNDALLGLNGNDTLHGGDGNDTLNGGFGADVVDAGGGDDTVNYFIAEGVDAVDGGAGNDSMHMIGNATAQVVNVVVVGGVVTTLGGGLISGIEAITLDGQTGIDTLTYAGTVEAVAVDLGAGTASGFSSVTGIEQVVGGSGNDTLVSASGRADGLIGGAGNDVYGVNDAADAVVEAAGGGTDEVNATSASYTLGVNVENLRFTGLAGAFSGVGNTLNNVITGGAGNDTLQGLAGNDTLHGGDGNDTLDGGIGNDVMDAGAGDDTINYTINDGVDTVDGGTGVDTLRIVGNATAQTVNVVVSGGVLTSVAGGAVSGVEAITLDGQAGVDTLTYAGTLEGVTVDLGAGTGSGFSAITGIEQVVGGSGNDTLVSAAGRIDTLIGGLGNDIYGVNDATDAVVESAGQGTDEVQATSASYTLGINVENLRFTGLAGNFTGTGNTSDNEITGGTGDDVLSGLAGNDTLHGGDGNDTLNGGGGNDVIDAGAGNDTINYNLTEFVDTVDGGTGVDTLNLVGTTGNQALNVVFAGGVLTSLGGGAVSNVESITLDMLAGVDTLSYAGTVEGVTVDFGAGTASGFTSIAGIEGVTGGSGNDTLISAAGRTDGLIGGAGDDVYGVNDATDSIVEVAGQGTDEVRTTTANWTLGLNLENLRFVAPSGNFTGTGNTLDNVITGGGGNDTLSGLAGNDTLAGGAGNDRLSGGVGNDVFMFSPGLGQDTITDFDADIAGGGQDLMNVGAFGIIDAADFAARVSIAVLNVDSVGLLDTVVTIDGTDQIVLLGVNGAGANVVTQADFLLV